jgi:hypothetical protein
MHDRVQLRLLFVVLMTSAVAVGTALDAAAQELEPRAYSASPVGTNFIAVGTARSSGSVVVDSSLPLADVDADVNHTIFGLGRTFGLLGRQALATAALPYAFGSVEGKVGPELEQQRITRSGLGDLQLLLAVNLRGSPALSPTDFATAQRRGLLVGTSLRVHAPTGQYDPARLINLSANRWAVKPEIGVSYPLGNFYLDFYSGVWLFQENGRYFPGTRVSRQSSLTGVQAHISYTVRPRFWLALDATWYFGGTTRVGDDPPSSGQNNTRVGAVSSFPLSQRHSLKIAYSNGVTVSRGANFSTVAVAWQFLWFDGPAR